LMAQLDEALRVAQNEITARDIPGGGDDPDDNGD
jgi:hypothetical protein